jgi:hypothetical protein
MYGNPMKPKSLSSRQRLAKKIRGFLARTGMSPTPFGLLAARDDKLLWRIENAKYGISLDKADRIYAFMETYDRSIKADLSPAEALEAAKIAVEHDPTEDSDGHQLEDREQEAPAGRSKARSLRNAAAGHPCPVDG